MKDLVPYQESYELKQLGFDEPCFGFYTYKRELRRYTNFDGELNDFQTLKNSSITMGDGWCTAPTFSQAFRFFREKYKLVHEICEHPKEMIDYVASASKGERYLPTYSYGYSSGGHYRPISNTYVYEEAEIGCLRKFIEIVK